MPENDSTHGNDIAVTSQPSHIGRLFRSWGPVALIALCMVAAWLMGWHEYLTLNELIRNRMTLVDFVASNTLLALAIYGTLYVLAVTLSFPGASLLTIAGGFLFGWVLGGIATVFAATFGATLIFLVARSSLGAALTRRAGPFLERLAAGFQENAFNYLLFLRLTPVFPFWLINIAPAMLKVPLSTYALATLIGIVPGTFAFAFIGSGLDSVIAAQETANPGCALEGTCSVDVGALVTPELIGAFFALGIAALIPIGLKKLKSGKPNR